MQIVLQLLFLLACDCIIKSVRGSLRFLNLPINIFIVFLEILTSISSNICYVILYFTKYSDICYTYYIYFRSCEIVSSLPGTLLLLIFFTLFCMCFIWMNFWMVSTACQQIHCWKYNIYHNSSYKYNGCPKKKPFNLK